MVLIAGVRWLLSANPSPDSIGLSRKPLSLVFLIDASGSMKRNDPRDIRKAAAQAAISLLSPMDEVAIVEFDADARVLSGSEEQPWIKADQTGKLFGLVQQIGNKGEFTDFRAGLEKIVRVFDGVPNSRRKVVLLLSDGILEPNPIDNAYTPHQYSYLYRIKTSGVERRREINDEYRQMLSPISRRMIFEEILPRLRTDEVEIFTVALSAQADQAFLQSLSNETTRTPTELHSFYAERATDLVSVFTRLLQYWTNLMILQRVEGKIQPGQLYSIFLDKFVMEPHVLALIDGEGEFVVRTQSGLPEVVLHGTHPALKLSTVNRQSPPASWVYGFQSGLGEFEVIWTGISSLTILTSGLRAQYNFGEPVESQISLRVGNSDAAEFLSPGARVVAEIGHLEQMKTQVEQELSKKDASYFLHFIPNRSGTYALRFVAYAKDREGREILPRPSVKYQFEVLPAFYVVPRNINLGRARANDRFVKQLEVHSGLRTRVDVRVAGKIISSSNRSVSQVKNEFPVVRELTFSIEPGTVRKIPVVIELPKEILSGDYEGEIIFQASSGEKYSVSYRLHVPSLWEKLTPFIMILLFAPLVLLLVRLIVAGFLVAPYGVLIPLRTPPGAPLLPNIRLSEKRRALFSGWLSWKRNRLLIGQRGADISLPNLSKDLEIELSFYRWGAYIKNCSPEECGLVLQVEEPGVGTFNRAPGETLALKPKSRIRFDGYEFRYEK